MQNYKFQITYGVNSFGVLCNIDGVGGELPPLYVSAINDPGAHLDSMYNKIRQHIVFSALKIEKNIKPSTRLQLGNFPFRKGLDHERMMCGVVEGKRVPFMMDAPYSRPHLPDPYELVEDRSLMGKKNRTWIVRTIDSRFCWYYPNSSTPRVLVESKYEQYADRLFRDVEAVLHKHRSVYLLSKRQR